MKPVTLIQFCLLLGSYRCASSVSVSTSTTIPAHATSASASAEDELVPLELPAEYEDKIKTVLPELLDKLGVPSSLIASNGLGILSSSLSNLSNGFGYFKSWSTSEQDSACKSKLFDGRLKVTKFGQSMCRKQCLDASTIRVDFIRSALETISTSDGSIEADIEVNRQRKMYECVFNGQRYDCVCVKNETLKVTPTLKALIFQLFQGGDKRRDLIPDHSLGKIVMLILLFLAEKSIEVVAAPVLVPLKMIYHLYQIVEWLT